MEPKIETVVKDVFFARAPHWDIETKSLYFIDSGAKTINRYEPATNLHFSAELEISSNFLIPVEERDNKFAISVDTEIAIVVWDGVKKTVGAVTKIVDIDKNAYLLKYTKCDEFGRLWTGSVVLDETDDGKNSGALYSFRVGTLKKHFDDEIVSSFAWSRNNSKMFILNAIERRVDVCDFDILNGKITNRQVLFSFDKHQIIENPNDMISDRDDNLWLSVLNGGKIFKISSKKPETLLHTLTIPMEQVTSLVWGGEGLDELYVTTGSFSLPSFPMEGGVNAALYKVTGLQTKGLPMHTFSHKYLLQ